MDDYVFNGPLTFEAFVWPSADQTMGVIAGGSTTEFALYRSLNQNWHFQYRNGFDRLFRWSSLPQPRNSKLHVAGVWTGEETLLFLNGNRQDTQLQREELGPGPRPATLRIGRQNHEGRFSRFFQGIIDEVRVSTVARYAHNFVPQDRFETDDYTFALYHFDEGQGDKLIDSSGNGRHGIIKGAKWVRVSSDGSPLSDS